MLFVLEKRPPISNSVSNEKAPRCLDHFLPGFFVCCFSDTSAPLFFLRLRAQKKNRKTRAMAATTIGTATAALRPGEHDMLLHFDDDTVTADAVALLAALPAVLATLVVTGATGVLPAVLLAVMLAVDVLVESVVGAAADAEEEAGAGELVALAEVIVAGVGLPPAVLL
jgi:hypothetical protein